MDQVDREIQALRRIKKGIEARTGRCPNPLCRNTSIRLTKRSRRQDVGGTNARQACSRDCYTFYLYYMDTLGPKRRREDRRTYSTKPRVRGRYQPIDPMAVFERDNWVCYLCGRVLDPKLRGTFHPDAPTIDHVRALERGGDHTLDNVATACRSCNTRKNTQDPADFVGGKV